MFIPWVANCLLALYEGLVHLRVDAALSDGGRGAADGIKGARNAVRGVGDKVMCRKDYQ